MPVRGLTTGLTTAMPWRCLLLVCRIYDVNTGPGQTAKDPTWIGQLEADQLMRGQPKKPARHVRAISRMWCSLARTDERRKRRTRAEEMPARGGPTHAPFDIS
jgi:hypothetical protein